MAGMNRIHLSVFRSDTLCLVYMSVDLSFISRLPCLIAMILCQKKHNIADVPIAYVIILSNSHLSLLII